MKLFQLHRFGTLSTGIQSDFMRMRAKIVWVLNCKRGQSHQNRIDFSYTRRTPIWSNILSYMRRHGALTSLQPHVNASSCLSWFEQCTPRPTVHERTICLHFLYCGKSFYVKYPNFLQNTSETFCKRMPSMLYTLK